MRAEFTGPSAWGPWVFADGGDTGLDELVPDGAGPGAEAGCPQGTGTSDAGPLTCEGKGLGISLASVLETRTPGFRGLGSRPTTAQQVGPPGWGPEGGEEWRRVAEGVGAGPAHVRL